MQILQIDLKRRDIDGFLYIRQEDWGIAPGLFPQMSLGDCET